MIVVVTGSNGFIGNRLVDLLLRRGHTVRSLVRQATRRRREGVTSYEIDYRRPNTIASSGALEGVDLVIHLAGVTKALSSEAFRAGNVDPVRSMLEALHMVGPPLERLVLVSSQAAAGPAPGAHQLVTEADDPEPFEAYGRSKFEAERLVQEQSGSVPFTIVRPTAVYGPGDVDFLTLFRQLRFGAGLYPANRESRIAVIYVDDLIEGILQASEHVSARGQVFFLTNEESVSWQDVYRHIAHVMDRPMRFEMNLPAPVVALAGRLGDVTSRLSGRVSFVNSNKVMLGKARYWICSAEKAKTLLGYTPATPLQAGLARTYEWYRENGWL